MFKATKRAFEVEVLQWDGKERPMFDFLTNSNNRKIQLSGGTFEIKLVNGGCQQGDLYIKTLNGLVLVKVNDYVIKGYLGEFYPCDESVFEETYDIVEDTK
jgi:hypothetical protein